MILVIDRRETTLRHQGGVLRIEYPGQAVRHAPIAQLDLAVVYGNPLAETAVWRALANAGVPTLMFPARGADQPAMLGGGLAIRLPIRRLQHRHADNPQASLSLVRWFIRHKLLGYDLPIQVLVERHGLNSAERNAFLARRNRALDNLDEANDYDQLVGTEGQMAQAWFGLIAATLHPAWQFSGRNRQPPRDPVNALLSLGYTLLGAEVYQGIIAAGLDPSLGFLHKPTPGRESMALDLTEPFRCGVDHFALNWIDPAGPNPRHWYYREHEGCRLSKAIRPDFYTAWANRREQWPYPLNTDPSPTWPAGHLREQINGWIERLRAAMKTLLPDTTEDSV